MNDLKNDQTIAAKYQSASANIAKVEADAVALRRLLDEQAENAAAAAEQRRREQDQAVYDAAVERRRVEDENARYDKERREVLAGIEGRVQEAQEELKGLLGTTDYTPKGIRVAFDAKIAQVDKVAEGRGRGMAKADYDTQKRIDDATTEKTSALIVQENKQLKERNAALEKEVLDLRNAQSNVVNIMKDLGLGALNASAGIQNKANEALQTAVAAGTPRQTR